MRVVVVVGCCWNMCYPRVPSREKGEREGKEREEEEEEEEEGEGEGRHRYGSGRRGREQLKTVKFFSG